MSGFDKVVSSYQEALTGLKDNMTIIAGGFGLCGIPEGLIQSLTCVIPVFSSSNFSA